MRKPRRSRPAEERFWERVRKTDGCWLYGGCLNDAGYGLIRIGGRRGKNERAHRLSWLIHYGKIPDGLIVLHKCDTPACVNPEHLRVGTHQDNTDDKIAKGRLRFGHVPGVKHGSAKLTDLLVRLARAFVEDGIAQNAIAKEFGVATATLNAAIIGKTWKHV